MPEPERCPHCGADLTGEPIPKEWRDLHYGGSTHYSRKISVIWRDRIVEWACPDCGMRWKCE